MLAGTTPVIVRLTTPVRGEAPRFPIPTIHAIPEEDSFPGITTIVMRPDGYVAWAGDDEEELNLAIGQWFRVPSPQLR
jgi:hypothetical protein